MVAARIRHLRLTAAVTAGVLVLATALGGLIGGGLAAFAVAAGVALVAASYIATTVAVAWADSIAPKMVFSVGMGLYLIKFSLFGVMLDALNGAEWAGRVPMAIGIGVGVVAWIASQAWWTVRHTRGPVSAPDPAP